MHPSKPRPELATDLDTALPTFEAGEALEHILAAEDAKPALKPAWATVDLPPVLAFTDKPAQRIFYDYSEVDNAIALLQALPGPGETIHAVMDSHFKGIDLVPAILKLAQRPAREVIVTTLGFNRRDAACLCELKARGEIQNLAMVCSVFFSEKDMGAYDYARERFAAVAPASPPAATTPSCCSLTLEVTASPWRAAPTCAVAPTWNNSPCPTAESCSPSTAPG